MPAAGHRDVQVLTVHPRPDQHDAHIGGGALSGVDGGGPAVLGVLGQVGRRQHGPATAGEVLHDQAVLWSGTEDLEAVAVADMAVPDDQSAVVAPGPEDIAGLPVPATSCSDRAGDLTGGDRGGAGQQVERVDVHPGPGQHQCVLPVFTGRSPVPEHAVEGAVAVVAGVQPAGGAVGRDRIGLAVTERE